MGQHSMFLAKSTVTTVAFGGKRSLRKLGNMKETPEKLMFGALRKSHVIGPFFFEGVTMNGE